MLEISEHTLFDDCILVNEFAPASLELIDKLTNHAWSIIELTCLNMFVMITHAT